MSRPPEDRNPELRAIFFESANELLQSLNEAGLELEAHPADEEVIRRVRRAVHTLKGDSAACGFNKLSELAHELEDILTPQVAQKYGSRFAEVVLAAADSFEAMLSSYQRGKKLPSLEKLRALIRGLLVDVANTPEEGSATACRCARNFCLDRIRTAHDFRGRSPRRNRLQRRAAH